VTPSPGSAESWWALDIRVALPEQQALAAWLVERTGQAVEEHDDGTLVTFAADEAAADALAAAIADRTAVPVVRRRLEPSDWSTKWREGLGPRHFGRLTVLPSWVNYSPASNEVVLVLDPESAFGSGEHGSTRAAVTLLERHLRPGDLMLDLGSGSGILAIAAALLGAARAIGIEVDEEAHPVALRNAGRNHTLSITEFLVGDAGDLAPLLGPADLICSNILRSVNQALLPSIHAALRPGGRVILAGMEAAESSLFRPPLDATGFVAVEEVTDAGWWAVVAERR